MKLKLGKMTSKQLAQWMGISYSYFRQTKQKNLEKIESYCDFEPVYGGIFVKEIYDYEYDKCAPEDKKVFLLEINAANDGLSSVLGMSRKLQKENAYYAKLSNDSVQRRMRKMNPLFGVYPEGQKETQGKLGSRKWVYAIRLDQYNHYRVLTLEEQKIFRQIVKSVYGTDTEKVMEMMLLEEAFKQTDMSKEQYLIKKERFELDLFPDILRQFKLETGLTVSRIQAYKLNQQGLKLVSAF